MTIGIYSLFLGEANRYYIGQSIDIERRVIQHKYLLNSNKHYNHKMQNTFNKNKVFMHETIVECRISELDSKEIEYINNLNSTLNGYNTTGGGKSARGLEHGSCKYTEEQITNAFILLQDPHNSFDFISEITELTVSSVRHLSRRETHKWLDELYPEYSANLIFLKDAKVRNSISNKALNHKFTALRDPSGIIHKVEPTIALFSRINNLDPNKVGALLLGNRKTHRGWTAINEGIE